MNIEYGVEPLREEYRAKLWEFSIYTVHWVLQVLHTLVNGYMFWMEI